MGTGEQSASTHRELLSSRVAAEVLASLSGIGLRQARAVLGAGLAGSPLVERGSHLFDAEAIERLVRRPVLDLVDLRGLCSGLLVLRRPVPQTLPWRDRADALSSGWDIAAISLVPVHAALAQGDVLVVGTVGSFVGTVATLADARTRWRERGSANLVLDAAPASCTWLSGVRIPSGRGRRWSWHDVEVTRRRQAS